jgi:type IX secretion system PorP/SprF family membrane protein
MKNKFINIFFLFLICQSIISQDFSIKNQDKIIGSINPSFYGFGDGSKVGLIYNSEGYNEANKIKSQFGFANYYFENNEFSFALDFSTLQINSLGYSTSQVNLHYIYKVQLTNEWIFNPSVSVGYGNSKLDFSSLVFRDQFDKLTGGIAGITEDKVSINNNANYIDIGAGASIYNDRNLFFGINVKHINSPETSFNDSSSNKKDLWMSLQAGYERDLNQYGQSVFLPENSYLYLYNSFTKQGSKLRADLYQEVILGNFSLGINEHFNQYDGFSVSQLGTSISIFIDQIEIGANYSFDIGSKKLAGTSFNTFEFYITFDFNPFSKDKRGNNSRFFNL